MALDIAIPQNTRLIVCPSYNIYPVSALFVYAGANCSTQRNQDVASAKVGWCSGQHVDEGASTRPGLSSTGSGNPRFHRECQGRIDAPRKRQVEQSTVHPRAAHAICVMTCRSKCSALARCSRACHTVHRIQSPTAMEVQHACGAPALPARAQPYAHARA